MAAFPVFMVVSSVILSVITLILVAFFIVRFSHPDDKNEARFPRIVVLLGLFLAFSAVLVLPFDVANARNFDNNALDQISVGVLWQIVFIIQAIFVVLVIPFAFWFYESDVDRDELRENNARCQGQLCTAIKFTVAFLIVFIITLVLMWAFLSTAEVPVTRQTRSIGSLTPAGTEFPSELQSDGGCPDGVHTENAFNFATSDTAICQTRDTTLNIIVTFPIYVIAMLAFIGWFAFTIFVGVGLISLPLDLLNQWRTRPVPIKLSEFEKQKNEIGARARTLREAGDEIIQAKIDNAGNKMSRKERRNDRKIANEFEQAVYHLQKDYTLIQAQFHLKGGNPIFHWMKLPASILGFGLSLSWIIHIAIFVLPDPPYHPFLNNLFNELEIPQFSLFGVCAFAFYSFYLLWACVAGNFKLGLRIPLILKIYPMEYQNTYMNAFLVNTWVILLASVPTVQFCATAFPVYARGSDINVIFGNQVQHLRFFSYFFRNNVFIWAMLAISFLTLIYLCVAPKDRARQVEQQLKELASGKKSRRDLGIDHM